MRSCVYSTHNLNNKVLLMDVLRWQKKISLRQSILDIPHPFAGLWTQYFHFSSGSANFLLDFHKDIYMLKSVRSMFKLKNYYIVEISGVCIESYGLLRAYPSICKKIVLLLVIWLAIGTHFVLDHFLCVYNRCKFCESINRRHRYGDAQSCIIEFGIIWEDRTHPQE